MEGGSSARGAAAALSTLCLLLAAVAWRLSVPADVAAGMAALSSGLQDGVDR